MAQTTLIYRHVNYTQRGKFKKSLSHSLRIKTNEFKPNEWVDELSDHNYIFSPKNPNGVKLNSFSETQLNDFIDNNLREYFDTSTATKEDKSNFAKYEYKLKKKIEKATTDGDEHIATALQYIADNKPKNYAEIINELNGVKRQKQLITMLDKYIGFAKAVEGFKDGRKAKMHEAFFKFPHRHGVKPEPKRMADCIRSFYEEVAPNHKAALIVVHDDERKVDAETGAHPHIFIPTRDRVTGELNLAATLRDAVNSYLEKKPTRVQLWNPDIQKHEVHTISKIDPTKVGSYAATKLQGIIMQDMFMEHAREHFPELSINFTEKRSRKVMAFHKQYEDAKLPKAEREHNLNNMLVEENKQLQLKMAASAKAHKAKMAAEVKAHRERLEAEEKTHQAKLDKATATSKQKIKVAQDALHSATKAAEECNAEVKKLNKQISTRKDRVMMYDNQIELREAEINKKDTTIANLDTTIANKEAHISELKNEEKTLLKSISEKVLGFMQPYAELFRSIIANKPSFKDANTCQQFFRAANEDVQAVLFKIVDANEKLIENEPNIAVTGRGLHKSIHKTMQDEINKAGVPPAKKSPIKPNY